MTLEDAKKEIEENLANEEQNNSATRNFGVVLGLRIARDILAKVDSSEPDEEGRAVLELIQSYGYWICSEKESDSTGDHQHWVKVSHVFANDPDFVRIKPVEELAKVKEKLGWGG